MWKPNNCIFAQKEELLNLAKKAFLGLSKYDLKDLLQCITTAIAIVAFLHAVNYFAAKPSLRIGLHSSANGYYMVSLLKYYQDNNITFPKQLSEDQSLHKIFSRDTHLPDPNHIQVSDGVSDEAVIKALARGQDIGSFIERRIDQIERQIGKYTYMKHIYIRHDERGFYDEQKFTPTREYIKSKLSTSDYYKFMVALIYSREVDNTIFIKNDGDMDLKNVKITFPAPLSKVTETRANNILSRSVSGTILNEVVDGTSDITLRLPSLKKGEFLSIDIITRENEINSNEVFTSYERDNLIDRTRVFLSFSLILIIMIALSLYQNRRMGNSTRGSHCANAVSEVDGSSFQVPSRKS